MTTETKTTTTKQVPSFYIFENIETEGERERRPAGAAFAHKAGGGFNIVIDGQRFVAFPPKAKQTVVPETSGTESELAGALSIAVEALKALHDKYEPKDENDDLASDARYALLKADEALSRSADAISTEGKGA